ncbi:hypothetical protein QBC43DRAFT_354610 [Cladorrhinum sp. PSN259]|nr:hypothetical protein QBC43DRAFT_354610 [Cladorrhinum sp. PSN259]
MYLQRILTACLGLGSLAVGAPTRNEQDFTASGRGLNNTKRTQKRTLPLGPGLPVLDGVALDQLTRLAELEFAGLVESQIALATQLETIKNNIRINSFRSQFAQAQVNCIILTVTNVIDQRDPSNISNRYLLNQLRIDNGFPDKEVMVMVTDAQTMTISTTPTVGSLPTSTLEPSLAPEPTAVNPSLQPSVNPVLPSFSSPTTSSSVTFSSSIEIPTPTAIPTESPSPLPSQTFSSSLKLPLVPSPSSSPLLRRQLLLDQPNAAILLPIGVLPPSAALILQDPANIILPGVLGGGGLFVESLATFNIDCRVFGDSNGFLIGGQFPLYNSVSEALLELEKNLGLLDPGRFPSGFETVTVPNDIATSTDVFPTEVPTFTEVFGTEIPTATNEFDVTATDIDGLVQETTGPDFGDVDVDDHGTLTQVIPSGTTTTTLTVVVTETAVAG